MHQEDIIFTAFSMPLSREWKSFSFDDIRECLKSDAPPGAVITNEMVLQWIFHQEDLHFFSVVYATPLNEEPTINNIHHFKLRLCPEAVKAWEKSIPPYSPCPCKSGKKFRFCCGNKSMSPAEVSLTKMEKAAAEIKVMCNNIIEKI
jgi:hypothetical protein